MSLTAAGSGRGARAPSMIQTSLTDAVTIKLRDGVISGEHPVDRPIRQDAVALALGVSKIPVREALNRLQHEGLLVSHPKRGFVVRRVSASEALEIIDMRLGLEGRLLADALERTDPAGREAVYARAQAAGAALRPDAPPAWPGCFLFALTRQGSLGFTRIVAGRLWTLSEHHARSSGDPVAVERAAAYRRSLLVAWRSGRPGVIVRAAQRGLTAEHQVLSAALALPRADHRPVLA